MRPIEEATRVRFLRLSAVLCAISLLLAPLAGRSALELRAERAIFTERLNPPDLHVDDKKFVAVNRDPFAAPVQHSEPVVATPPASSTSGPLVASTIGVLAIVSGREERALVDEGGRARVVQPGDTIAGARILSIDAVGIHLDNGVLLAMPQVTQ